FYGAHISLFTLLYGVSMIAYTWYNSKQMDMSQMGGGKIKKSSPLNPHQRGGEAAEQKKKKFIER
ncbi:MAG: hypothetical protein AAGJ18_08170, partial [Bacteroidota bacterium]